MVSACLSPVSWEVPEVSGPAEMIALKSGCTTSLFHRPFGISVKTNDSELNLMLPRKEQSEACPGGALVTSECGTRGCGLSCPTQRKGLPLGTSVRLSLC